MDWKRYISELSWIDKSTHFEFYPPATDLSLQDLKAQFNLTELPSELEGLFNQTNGIDELLGSNKIAELIWPIDKIIETNKEYKNQSDFRDLYMSFEQLLFISDAGNGDLFGFITLNGRFDRNDIFVWNHGDDSRTWVAPNLETFIEWWTNGTIKV